MKQFIEISNSGPDIISTNYWETDHAKKGKLFFSINAGCIRILLPDCAQKYLAELQSGKYVILSRGAWPEQGRDVGFELLFEDDSDSPFMLHVGVEQWDMVPAGDTVGQKWRLAVWMESGKKMDVPCYYRIVPEIPYMKEWGSGNNLGTPK